MTSNEAQRALAAAIAHHQAGRLPEAEAGYRHVLAHRPRHADALHFFAVLLHQTGRAVEALPPMRQSVELNPAAGHYRANYANLLCALGDAPSAVEQARAAIALNVRDADGHRVLGAALRATGDLPGAVAAFETALRLRPGHPSCLVGLSEALVWLGRFDDAIALLQRAVSAHPRDPAMRGMLATALEAKADLEAALRVRQEAVEIAPNDAPALSNLGQTQLELGLLDDAVGAFARAVALDPALHPAGSNALMAMNYRDGLAPATTGTPEGDLFAAHAAWARRFAEGLYPSTVDYANDRDASRRLRVGYVSPDFRSHSVSTFFEPLIASHDREAVEVFCYSDAVRTDAVTERLRAAAEHWRPIAGLSDDLVAARVREDRIDILVDLAGHTRGNRLLLFARRPAPVQVSYLGWQNTTGMQAIDWRLTDEVVDPPGQTDAFHTETLHRLPAPFAVYRPPDAAPPVDPPPALASGAVTFGSFAKVCKITDAMLDLWARVLAGVPRSRLLIVASAAAVERVQSRIRARLSAGGVAPDRVGFRGELRFDDYLSTHREVDLILDTSPFNGHTTTCHGLWMGVPTLTLAGRRYASRMGLGVLSAVGFADAYAGFSPDGFVQAAVRAAADLAGLTRVRAELRERMRASPLMDGRRLARSVEAAYREFWRRWVEGSTAGRSG